MCSCSTIDCTDPRTMRKHAAYTEWADAYSCSRHRCQPGGRNLAIYTVGCKRVEAPESAIECEEVVEDTNMQFPYCCTRLRCLVVVRGEVWTRVLGQPWETLPAAPWSHMYKMKKPPPQDTAFLPKSPEQGPIYELAEPESEDQKKVLRSSKTTEAPDCNDVVPRASAAGPDIVIALSTNGDQSNSQGRRESRNEGRLDGRHKRNKQGLPSIPYFEEEKDRDVEVQGLEEIPVSSDRPLEQTSEEKMFINAIAGTQRPYKNARHQPWTEIPQAQWSDDVEDTRIRDEPSYAQADFPEDNTERTEDKPSNLQALVDAIGTRMRDIENVVQRMSDKVQHVTPGQENSAEKIQEEKETNKRHKIEFKEHRAKNTNPDGDTYTRFVSRGSKYLHTGDFTTEPPIFVEDSHLNGYYSDASNSLIRRSNGPKEPPQTYMAPVDTRRKSATDTTEEEKKHKKHHKRKRNKHAHKKHHKDDKRKRFNKLSSPEVEKNAVSLEDSSAVTK